MHQFLGSHMKGEQLMVCENLFKLYGTSSKEIEERTIERTKAIYIPQIQQLTNDISNLANENSRLKELLKLHKIAF